MDDQLEVPQGTFVLHRTPASAAGSLRAWDGADAYLLERLHERCASGEVALGATSGRPLIIVNDAFGALAVSLSAFAPVSILDSATARQALVLNLERNGVAAEQVRPSWSTDAAGDAAVPGIPAAVVLVKVPRSRERLEQQLRWLRPWLGADTVVMGGGLTRHVHSSTVSAFEDLVGPTLTTLARRKARLLEATVDLDLAPGPGPWPNAWDTEVHGHTVHVVNHAGVFSAGRLDRGTHLLLQNLPARSAQTERVADLGCGNGVLGAAVALVQPGAHVLFIDDSALAVASARATHSATIGSEDSATFVVGHRLVDSAGPGSLDLVVCNPPFHADNALSTAVAREMFADAHRCLREGGELMVVGNRHLNHHRTLTRLFGGHRVVASDPKFVVLSATR